MVEPCSCAQPRHRHCHRQPSETWQLLVTVLKDSGAVCPVGTDLLHVKAVVCLVLDLAVVCGGFALCGILSPFQDERRWPGSKELPQVRLDAH